MTRLLYFPIYTLALPAYLLAIFAGYSVGIPKLWPSMPSWGVAVLAIVSALLVWGLVLAITQLHKDREAGAANKAMRVLLYVGVFCLSGLGIANAMFYYFEVPTVLKETLDTAATRVSQLRAVANETLPPTEFNEFSAKVMSLVGPLVAEVKNPSKSGATVLCGVGTQGREHISKIQQYLPAFSELYGSEAGVLNCGDRASVEEAAKSYELLAQNLLRQSDIYVNSRGGEREQLLNDINTSTSKFDEKLAELSGALETLSNLPHDESPEVRRMVAELASLESSYRANVLHLQSLVPGEATAGLEPDLALNNMRRIGDFLSTIQVLIERLRTGSGEWYNVLYFIVPLLLDVFFVLMVLHLSKHVRPAPPIRRTRSDGQVRYIMYPPKG